jgi:hypothetical protein
MRCGAVATPADDEGTTFGRRGQEPGLLVADQLAVDVEARATVRPPRGGDVVPAIMALFAYIGKGSRQRHWPQAALEDQEVIPKTQMEGVLGCVAQLAGDQRPHACHRTSAFYP